LHWYDWHTVTERLQGRSYAITRGKPYRVILDPATSTGVCDFTNKRIIINPNIFDDVFRRRGLADTALDQANFLISRGVTGHKALHVLYSDPKDAMRAASESPILKTVFNLLEDARIEKIGSESSHVAKTLFAFVNTIAAGELTPPVSDTPADPDAWLDLLLRWRLSANIPPLHKTSLAKWMKVKVLADKALYAPGSSEALALAKKIVKLLHLDEQQSQDAPNEILTRMQSNMTGDSNSDPLPNPLNENDDSGQDNEEKSEEAQKEASLSETDPGHKDTDSGAETDETPQGQQAEDSAGEGEEQEQENDSPSKTPSAGGDEREADPIQGDDLEKLIEEVAASASEDLGSVVPQDGEMTAHSQSCGGRQYSDIEASPYIAYMPLVVPIADEIVRELKTENPKAISGASESGRFKARYFVRDPAKPFAAQRFRGIGTPKMALTLVIDRSASMEDIVEEVRIMSMSTAMACEKLAIPLSIWALEGQVHVKKFEEHGPQVLAKLAGINAETYTRMMPTVRDAHEELVKRPEEIKQIVLIHDGLPGDGCDFIDWRKSLKGIGLFCLRIMSEIQYEAYHDAPQDLRESMDNLVGPQHYAIAPVTDIAKHWLAFIRNKRNSHSTTIP
jgi:hypothetical protein